ncbi:uncharacterized protein YgbK (DUF1537 family) [Rhizobium sp. BK313]|uniref:four-carbon acid sugar kinase family protein n=1 Tax=Rhizobium sp. BK313 TaxID=2587081 RepID=UPI0014150B00|nr:four-carbon acid sugar kinase family protein [Rhizobium sp. BK313]MBB3459377.1 uncharacterized protein YgbK (DUF1537 family) [Rhizobium sp. BK313]
MRNRWLVVADDLIDTANCAVAFRRRGFGAAVSWASTGEPNFAESSVFSFHVDSGCMRASAATKRHEQALAEYLVAGRMMFKKIDSTMKGQPAADIAPTPLPHASRP